MWQRSQTLYLAIATVLMASLFFCAKAVIPGGETGVMDAVFYREYIPYAILIAIIVALGAIALMAYKFRTFQMRTTVLAMIITVALQAWLVVDYFTINGVGGYVFRFTAIFPLISLIFEGMALKGIISDIMVAESVNHLRSYRKKHRR